MNSVKKRHTVSFFSSKRKWHIQLKLKLSDWKSMTANFV